MYDGFFGGGGFAHFQSWRDWSEISLISRVQTQLSLNYKAGY